MTDAERRGWFDYYLQCAVFFAECRRASCVGIDHETWAALQRVAGERTIESVIEAREVFERDLTGVRTLEERAVLQAARAGEIASTTVRYTPQPATPVDGNIKKTARTNYLDGMRFPDFDLAEQWLAVNRKNPGKIYREMVLDQT